MKKCKDCAYSTDYDPKCETFFCLQNGEWGEEQDEDASIMCDHFVQRGCDVCRHVQLCNVQNMMAWAKKAKVKLTIDARKCVYCQAEVKDDD